MTNGAFVLPRPVGVFRFSAVGGALEGEGPLGNCFDEIEPDDRFGQDTWEQAEGELQHRVAQSVLRKLPPHASSPTLILAGDLENQCTASNFGLLPLQLPFFGLYGACSTMIEGLTLGGLLLQSGILPSVLAVTSSHFCAAEREYRMPLCYGSARAPTSQHTATAAGAMILTAEPHTPALVGGCIGTVTDFGVKDSTNMGAAMAPAACRTLVTYLQARGKSPDDYDRIVTGDLGAVGSALFLELCRREGLFLDDRHRDCGLLLYDRDKQPVYAGGSGCGCMASVLCGHFLPELQAHRLHRILVIGTGALLSAISSQQGRTVPGIAHLAELSDHIDQTKEGQV